MRRFLLITSLLTATASVCTPAWTRTDLRRMGYIPTYGDRTSGPINAIFIDARHGTLWGGSSNNGEDYGIGW